MIQLPADWLHGQFDGFITRGGVIRFHADDLDDPDHPGGKTKFAVILNAVCPQPEVLYVFATSKTDFYDKHQQFKAAIIRVPPGTYAFFPLATIIPFRHVHGIAIEKLRAQYAAGNLTFCGQLSVQHVTEMDGIIQDGLFISPRMQKRILA